MRLFWFRLLTIPLLGLLFGMHLWIDSRNLHHLYVTVLLVLIWIGLHLWLRLLTIQRHLRREVRSHTTQIAEGRYRWQALAENFPNGAITLFDEDFRYRFAAGQGLVDIGLTPEDLLEHRASAALPDGVFVALEPSLRAVFTEERHSVVEVTVRDRILCVHVLPIRDEAGTVIGGMTMSQNITEQKRVEADLRASEENLRITLDAIGDGVIATDAQGRVRRMNPVAETLTGWTGEEAIGQHLPAVFKILDGMTREVQADPATCVLESGQRLEAGVQNLLVSRQGTERQVALSGAPIRDGRDRVVGVVLVVRDVTQQQQMEEQLRQSQKMDSLGQLAGGIAHDFNNMLGGILGYAEILADRMRGEAVVAEYTGKIIETTEHAADLTDKLLAFSRKGKVMSVDVDLHFVISEAVALLEHAIDKRINIVKHLNASRSCVRGDPGQLQNVLLNLCVNARDAMPDGGMLTLTTGNVILDEISIDRLRLGVDAGPFLRLTVADTGVGMSTSVRKRIFDPFFTTKDLGKGTGLGLAAVYGTLQEHHGAITVESEVGEGSEFTVYLPVQDCPAVNRRLTPVPVDRIFTGTVLLVDDEEVALDVAALLLKSLGFELLLARNGKEAIEIFKTHHDGIDLVLLDVVMPVINGSDCFRALHRLDPDVPIVLCSGFTRDAAVGELTDEGLAGFLKKPFTKDELARCLAGALPETGAEEETD